MISKGAIINPDDNHKTPLLMATSKAKFDVVKYLVEHGAYINIKNSDGLTPLIEAVRWGGIEMVKYLVSKGADINVGGDGLFNSALTFAASKNYLEIVKFFNTERYIFCSFSKHLRQFQI